MPRRPSTHVDDPVAVGRRLREARHAAGLTQRDLSFDGCTAAYVSRIEAGARVPSLQILHEFAKRLDVSPEYLATGQPDGGDLSSDLLEAEVALRLGDEQRAAELYEAAHTEADSAAALARAQLGLGRLALHRGDVPQGVALLEQALDSGELAPGDASSAASALGRGYVCPEPVRRRIRPFRALSWSQPARGTTTSTRSDSRCSSRTRTSITATTPARTRPSAKFSTWRVTRRIRCCGSSVYWSQSRGPSF